MSTDWRTEEIRGARCVTCHAEFTFDAAFYDGRGLRWPLRCRACREARRATMRDARGIVRAALSSTGGFIARSDGQDFLIFNKSEFQIGDTVRFQYDPGPLPRGASLRFAYSAERV